MSASADPAYEALYRAITDAGLERATLAEMHDVISRERSIVENGMLAAHRTYGAAFDPGYARRVAVMIAVERTLEAFQASEDEIRAVMRRAANRKAAA